MLRIHGIVSFSNSVSSSTAEDDLNSIALQVAMESNGSIIALQSKLLKYILHSGTSRNIKSLV